MRGPGIYKIQSKHKPERIYIGSAININRRWSDHKKRLKANNHPNKKLQNHYNKYGDVFEYTVLMGCEKENLLKHEQFFIDTYSPWFNNTKTAGSCLGCKASEETRERLRKSHIGKPSPNKGKHLSFETIEKMKKSLKGRTVWNKGIKTGLIPANTFKKGDRIRLGCVKYANDEERLLARRESKRKYRLKLKGAA